MKNKTIETIYDNMETQIDKDLTNDKELQNMLNEVNKLDNLLKSTLSKEDYKLFDEYISKESQLIDLERKKSFSYGFNLSNKLLIDSLRE